MIDKIKTFISVRVIAICEKPFLSEKFFYHIFIKKRIKPFFYIIGMQLYYYLV